MGRRSKLAALDYIDGDTSRHKKLLKDAGVTGLGVPFVPTHLMDDARECVVAIQSGMPPGIYAKVDSYVLACFGVAWAMHKRAVEEINDPDFDWVFMDHKGVKRQSPWLKIVNTQASLVAALGARLGLDPLAREGLRLPEQRMQSKFHGLIGPALIEHNES